MKNLEKRVNLGTSGIGSAPLASALCGNSGLMRDGAVTGKLDSATAWHEMMLNGSGYSDLSPSGPEADEDADNEDYSWMDDMEAAGVSPV